MEYIGWIPCINGHLDFGLMRPGIQGGFTDLNSKDENAIEIIQIMSLSVIPITIVMTFISKFLGRGNSRITLIGTGIYVGIQIPTILLLTELFGVNGTASSVVIANTAHAIYFIFIDRYYSRKQFT